MKHNTQLPTSGMLSGKSKWEVERHPVSTGSAEHVWCAFHNENNIEETHRHFPTWREALEYADKQARTVEVTLPRLAPQGEVTVSATWNYDQQSIHYINSAGATVQGAPADLRPLALALLALAEQEVVE